MIQKLARDGVFGDFNELRRELCDEQSAAHPDCGISSSDVNHMVYSHIKMLMMDNESFGLVMAA